MIFKTNICWLFHIVILVRAKLQKVMVGFITYVNYDKCDCYGCQSIESLVKGPLYLPLSFTVLMFLGSELFEWAKVMSKLGTVQVVMGFSKW